MARFDPATRLTEGDHAEIWVDTRRVHVFDPDTGQNLTLGDSGSPATLTSPRSDDAPAQPEADATGQDTGSAAAPPVSQPSAAPSRLVRGGATVLAIGFAAGLVQRLRRPAGQRHRRRAGQWLRCRLSAVLTAW